VGINGCEEKVQILYGLGIRLFVLDTAHGYQQFMIENIRKLRAVYGKKIYIIAGNVITEDATRDLILA
jgi:IMP dehydrogenase